MCPDSLSYVAKPRLSERLQARGFSANGLRVDMQSGVSNAEKPRSTAPPEARHTHYMTSTLLGVA
jgi:hypothetical protein